MITTATTISCSSINIIFSNNINTNTDIFSKVQPRYSTHYFYYYHPLSFFLSLSVLSGPMTSYLVLRRGGISLPLTHKHTHTAGTSSSADTESTQYYVCTSVSYRNCTEHLYTVFPLNSTFTLLLLLCLLLTAATS